MSHSTTGTLGPLNGLRVVELASYIAIPTAGLVLAQLGADVIRIEPIGGGPDRLRWPRSPDGSSLYWNCLNGGKRALGLDLANPAAKSVLVRLAASGGANGGIVLSNHSRRIGLGFDDLVADIPKLIHVQLTGKRDGGPGVDYTANAASGFPLATGDDRHDSPVNHVLPAWDLLAGMYVATSVLAAVRHRDLTGAGSRIELALDDVALAVAGNLGLYAETLASDVPRGRIGNHVYGDFGRDFRTADGRHVMIVVLTHRHLQKLAVTLDLARSFATLAREAGADLTLASDRYRLRHRIGDLVQAWFADRSLQQAETVLSGSGLLWRTYVSFREATQQALDEHHPMFGFVGTSETAYFAAGSPVRHDGASARPAVAPEPGQHDSELLGLAGLSPEEVAALRADGVIADRRAGVENIHFGRRFSKGSNVADTRTSTTDSSS